MKTWITYLRSGLVALCLIVSGAQAATDEKDPAVAWEKIANGALLVDVRSAAEFASGHLDGAINIPHDKIAGEFAARNIAKDTPVVLYCRSGKRVEVAKEALKAAGYQALYNGGGYQTLNSQQPSTKPKPQQ